MAKTKVYYSEDFENCIESIKKHKLSAERIANKFNAVDLGRICAYLGIPNYGLRELEDAKLLVKALDYAPTIVEKPEAAKEAPVKRDEIVVEEVAKEDEVVKEEVKEEQPVKEGN